MGAIVSGLVNNMPRRIAAPDGSYEFFALDIVTERGVTFACQVWPNDPNYGAYVQQEAAFLNHRVRATVVSYSIGTRTFKSGKTEPQVRFRVTNLVDQGLPQDVEG